VSLPLFGRGVDLAGEGQPNLESGMRDQLGGGGVELQRRELEHRKALPPHDDLVGTLHHVGRGQDVAVLGDDEAGSQGLGAEIPG